MYPLSLLLHFSSNGQTDMAYELNQKITGHTALMNNEESPGIMGDSGRFISFFSEYSLARLGALSHFFWHCLRKQVSQRKVKSCGEL